MVVFLLFKEMTLDFTEKELSAFVTYPIKERKGGEFLLAVVVPFPQPWLIISHVLLVAIGDGYIAMMFQVQSRFSVGSFRNRDASRESYQSVIAER